jgi:hypothetical protein
VDVRKISSSFPCVAFPYLRPPPPSSPSIIPSKNPTMCTSRPNKPYHQHTIHTHPSGTEAQNRQH